MIGGVLSIPIPTGLRYVFIRPSYRGGSGGVSLLEGQSSAHVASAGVTITRRRSSWVLELQPSVLECMPVGELHVGVSYHGVDFNSGEVFTLPRLSDITIDCGV